MRRLWPYGFAIALLGLVYAHAGIGPAQAKWYLFALLLAAVTATDIRSKLIPDLITLPGTGLGLAAALAQAGWSGLGTAALGAAVGLLVLEVFRRLMGRLATMEVMGMGDSKLLMMCGAFLGPQLVILSLMPGVVIGLVFGIAYTRLADSPHFPFGPSLGLGALATGLYPDPIARGLASIPAGIQTLGLAGRLLILVVCVALLILLIRRIRRRAADYSRRIEDDYAD